MCFLCSDFNLSDDEDIKGDTMSDIEQKRIELLQKREELIARIEKIHNDRTRKRGPFDPDLSEQAIELENQEVLAALDKVERAELERVERELRELNQQ